MRMIEDQLRIIKKYKKTTDLFTKPLVYLNPQDLEIEELEERLPFHTKYTNKNIDRLSLTQKEEIKFQSKISKYLKDLLPSMEMQGIENIIDFHIKYHKIDQMNKKDLLFLLLPFDKYNAKIKALMSLKDFNIQILAKKLNDVEFLEFFMGYFEFKYLKNIKQFIEKVLMCYFHQHQKLKKVIVEILLNKISEDKENNLFKKLYKNIIKKTDLRLKEIKEEISEEKPCGEIEMSKINPSIKIPPIIKEMKSQTLKEFLKIFTEKNQLEVLEVETEEFKKKNIIEITRHLLNFNKPNFRLIKDFLNLKDLEFLNKKRLTKNEKENLYELIHLKDKSKFEELFLNKKVIKEEVLLYLLKKGLFEYESLLNSNLSKIYKNLQTATNEMLLAFYEFADYQNIEKYNEIIKNLIEMKKLPILDLNKLSSENKEIVLIKPEQFFENQLEGIIEKIKQKSNKLILIKNDLDLIDLEDIENKIIKHLIYKLSDKNNKGEYLKYLLDAPLNKYLINYINYKPIQIILEEICSTDQLMILENLLINKQKLIENRDYFEDLLKRAQNKTRVNKKHNNKELKELFEKNIDLYLNTDNPLINLKVVEIALDLEVQLLPHLKEIFNLLEIHKDVNLLNKLILKYKKILTPYLSFISKYSNIEILKIFEGQEVIKVLNQKHLLSYLSEVEITEEMFNILNKNLTLPILEILFKNKNIKKILNSHNSLNIKDFIKKLKELEILQFINKTINKENITFFYDFYELLLKTFKENKTSKSCLHKFINYASEYKINHNLLIDDLLNNEDQTETIAYILKHKNNLEFSLNFNKKILNEFKDKENYLLCLLNSIYEIFPAYKICLEESMPFFLNLLESENENLRIQTENLLTKIHESEIIQ